MPEWFVSAIQYAGLPFALVIAALVTGHRGWWVWSRELTREKDVSAQRVKDVEQRVKDVEMQLSEMRTDRDYYRRLSFTLLRSQERLAIGVEKAITGRTDDGADL